MDGGRRDNAVDRPQCGLWDGHLPLSDYNPTQRQTENGVCMWTLVCFCQNGEGKDVRSVSGASLTQLNLSCEWQRSAETGRL